MLLQAPLADAKALQRVIVVEPGDFVGIHQFRLDEAEVDRRERQSLKAQHRPFAARNRALLDHQQILDPDSERARRVIAGLIGHDHPRRERGRSSLGDALGTFVDGEI